MKIKDPREYAVGQGLTESEALKSGMQDKTHELAERGAEFYAKA